MRQGAKHSACHLFHQRVKVGLRNTAGDLLGDRRGVDDSGQVAGGPQVQGVAAAANLMSASKAKAAASVKAASAGHKMGE